jgi:aromatic ring hydroxylase
VTWVPEKENAAGKKMRSLKLELSTEPGNKDGKTLTKSFKILCSGSLKEWILWRTDHNAVCTGMSIATGSSKNRMIHQMLSEEPLKEFKRTMATFTTKTNANSNRALDAVAITIFPTNALKKYIRQGMGNPKVLTIRNVYTRICKLN